MDGLVVKIGILALMLFVAIFVFGAEKHGNWLEKSWTNSLLAVILFVAAAIVPYAVIKRLGKVSVTVQP